MIPGLYSAQSDGLMSYKFTFRLSYGTEDDIRQTALGVDGVHSVVEVRTLEPGLVGVRVVLDAVVGENRGLVLALVQSTCSRACAAGTRVVARSDRGERPTGIAQWVDDSMRASLIRAVLRLNERERALPCQAEVDADVDNFGDARDVPEGDAPP